MAIQGGEGGGGVSLCSVCVWGGGGGGMWVSLYREGGGEVWGFPLQGVCVGGRDVWVSLYREGEV